MEINQNVKIHNRFDMQVDNIETGKHEEFVGYNIVLDQMWTKLCAGSAYFVNIHFGTGTGTPTPERTTLFSYLGTKAATTEETIKAYPISSWKRKIVLAPEEYVGSTISEVGIAYGATSSYLVTHAMLKDSEGNPISIAKTSTDVVTIYATVFITLVENPLIMWSKLPTGNALLNYLLGSSAPTGSFGLLPGEGYGTRIGSTTTVSWTADTANKKRKTNVVRFDVNTGNGHVLGLDFTNVFSVAFPATGIFAGQSYTDVPVGTGNGTETTFTIPSKNLDSMTLNVKVNGVSTAVTQELSRAYNFTDMNFDALPANAAGEDACFSRDGKLVGFAHRHSPYFEVYDISKGMPAKREFSVTPTVTEYGKGIALNETGTRLFVTQDSSPYLRIYDWVGSKYVPATAPSFSGANGKVAVSLDGIVLAASAGSGRTIYVWDLVEGSWVARPNITYHTSDVSLQALDISDNGSVIVISSTSTNDLDIYDWIDNAWVRRLNPQGIPTSTNTMHARCSSDGNTIAYRIGTNVYVCTWDGSSWTTSATISMVGVFTDTTNFLGKAVLARNAEALIVHHATEGPAYFYKKDGSWITIGKYGATSSSREVAFSPDGAEVARIGISYEYLDDFKNRTTKIVFGTPPATDAPITADYSVKGLHKTDQYVVDASMAIQFGEGL